MKKKFKTKSEFSAGGVVYRRVGGKYEFLLGKHSGYHKWVLAKGLVEKGELAIVAAEREVEEELGVKVRVIGSLPIGTTEYYYFADLGELVGKSAKSDESARRVVKYQEQGGSKVRIHKRVDFYLMEYEEELGQGHGWEMEDRKWLGYKDAFEILAFGSEKEVLEKSWESLSDPRSSAIFQS